MPGGFAKFRPGGAEFAEAFRPQGAGEEQAVRFQGLDGLVEMKGDVFDDGEFHVRKNQAGGGGFEVGEAVLQAAGEFVAHQCFRPNGGEVFRVEEFGGHNGFMHKGFRRVRQALLKGGQRVWALVLPPSCPGCMEVLPYSEPVGFCATCYGKMPWWNTAQMLAPHLPPVIADFKAPCLYEEPLRNAILQLKFHDAVPFVKPLAKMLVPYVPADHTNLVLVPVASHRSRLRIRRYNHAALLVQRLSKLTGCPCNVTALKRVKAEKPQVTKTRAQRLKLPASDFWANPKVFAGKDVILVDDIYTTGATARACALALKKAGAQRIEVLTLAYTLPE